MQIRDRPQIYLHIVTFEATAKITEQIEEVQSSTADTVGEIDRIPQTIKSVNDIVLSIASAIEQQTITTEEIAGSIAQVSGGISDIKKKAGQNAQVVKGIADDMSEINQSSGALSKDSREIDLSKGH